MTRTLPLFIDGQAVLGAQGRLFEDRRPVDGRLEAHVALAEASDVDRAVDAARRALKGPWGRMSVERRCELLMAVADGIMARFEDFLAAEIADTGKPRSLASAIDIPRGAANLRVFAQLARSAGEQVFHMETPDGLGALSYVERRPVGVVGVICPWNLPLLLMTWKVAPALAAGNTVVVKPSEETPATATLLGEVMNQVGVPPGVYNVVHGFGPGCAGEALTQHPDLSAITFTGESSTGKAIMAQAARHLKKVSFELGGKNPAIIFADADFDEALAGTVRSVFANCGQVCLCSERVYVQRPIFERFVQALAAQAQGLVMGDPMDPRTTMGPLISRAHRDKVLRYCELALAEGAQVITGGHAPQLGGELDQGCFMSPTIWTGLPEHARCVREEIFGPVCHIQPFDDEDEVIHMANDTDYGLCAAVWTQHLRRAHRVASALDVGIVWVNAWFLRDLRTPFGGVKLSGIGREGGQHSLEFYSELKTICVKR